MYSFSFRSCKGSEDQGGNVYVLTERIDERNGKRDSAEVEEPTETCPLTGTSEDDPIESKPHNVYVQFRYWNGFQLIERQITQATALEIVRVGAKSPQFLERQIGCAKQAE